MQIRFLLPIALLSQHLLSGCWSLQGVDPNVSRRGMFDAATKSIVGVATTATFVGASIDVPVANAANFFSSKSSASSSSKAASTTTTTTTLKTSAIPPTGEKAPEFELPNSRGTGQTSLNKLIDSGKWTILYFYPGAFTQGCTMEARNFQRDIETYRTLNAQIVGVSVDPPEKNAQFCSAEGLDFYMLSDIGGRVSKMYGSSLSVPGFGSFSNRQTYIIDPTGNLRWIFTNVESRIPRHSAEVLDKLQELEATA